MRLRPALLAAWSAGCLPRLYTPESELVLDGWVPPENSWEVGAPAADLAGEGYAVGDVVPDFRLLDQHGDEVSLWQFYGSVVLLDVSTIWCAPCQELAQQTEETWQDFRDDGVVYITVLQEDLDGAPPDDADLLSWVDLFGITAPVLADGDLAGVGDGFEYPSVLTIGRDMRVVEHVAPADDEHVRTAILDLIRPTPEPEPRGCD